MIQLPADAPSGPVILHTDSARTRSLVPGKHDRQGFLLAHLDVLSRLSDGRAMWFPTFNYDYLGTRVFDVENDRAQVGSINEFARTSHATWRTATPVFNFAGSGPAPSATLPLETPAYPFDSASPFGQAVTDDGIVLWYGAPFSTATILHHAETAAGGPAYRYDKDFDGTVVRGSESTPTTLRYHVRPLDRPVDYDWDRIIPEAMDTGVIRELDPDASVYWASARTLVEYWVDRQQEDPLYLLNAESRAWIAPELDRLGRRFQLDDFEKVV